MHLQFTTTYVASKRNTFQLMFGVMKNNSKCHDSKGNFPSIRSL